jgi:hypothetical protein
MCGAVIERIPSVVLTDDQKQQWERWINALESGEFKQTTFALRDETGFCCLGVACNLVDPEGWTFDTGAHAYSFLPNEACSTENAVKDHLTPFVRGHYGSELGPLGLYVGGRFPDEEGNTLELHSLSLSGINDMGATFLEIAEILKKAMDGGYTRSVALIK